MTSSGKEACRLQKEKKERDMFSLQEVLVRSCFKQITVSKEQITGKPWCSLKCTKNEMYWFGKMEKCCVCTCTIKPIMVKEILQKMNTVIIYSPSCHCKTIGLSFFSEIKQEKLWKIYCALSMQLKRTETSSSKSYNYQMIKNKSKTCTVAISSKVTR